MNRQFLFCETKKFFIYLEIVFVINFRNYVQKVFVFKLKVNKKVFKMYKVYKFTFK